MMQPLENSQRTMLLIDDSDETVVLIREALKRVRPDLGLHHVHHGEEGLRFLRQEDSHANAPWPDFVLIDMNMPVMGGREFLSALVEDERLCGLPVIVWSTTVECEDVRTMYRLRCNGFVAKPRDFAGYKELLQRITDFWLDSATPAPRLGS